MKFNEKMIAFLYDIALEAYREELKEVFKKQIKSDIEIFFQKNTHEIDIAQHKAKQDILNEVKI